MEIIDESMYPAWYWKRGICDAKVVSICQQYVGKRIDKKWIENKIVIILDSRDAVYDTSIESIELINGSIISVDDLPLNTDLCWWQHDSILKDKKKYILDLTLRKAKKTFHLQFRFDEAIVKRKE